jgi:glycosyltransferase involved in cell wall biosynthesis
MVIIEDSELRGASWARNRGFEKVRTEYVLFSDNDINWEPDALWTLAKTLDAHPEASYAYGAYDLMSNNERSGQRPNFIGTAGNEPWSAQRLRDFTKGNFVSTMSLVRTRDFPLADESIKRLNDYDIWLTMLGRGKTGVFCGKKIFSTDLRKGITLGDDVTHREAMNRIIKKHNLG